MAFSSRKSSGMMKLVLCFSLVLSIAANGNWIIIIDH